jgi:hypothetical protein
MRDTPDEKETVVPVVGIPFWACSDTGQLLWPSQARSNKS